MDRSISYWLPLKAKVTVSMASLPPVSSVSVVLVREPRCRAAEQPSSRAAEQHAVVGEPGQCQVQERGAGGVLLVGVDLAVGQPGVVVDRGVDEVVAAIRASI